MDRTSAGNSLHRSYTLLLDRRRVDAAKDQLGRFASEGRDTGDGGIFVVQLGIVSENLVCLLRREDVVSQCEIYNSASITSST